MIISLIIIIAVKSSKKSNNSKNQKTELKNTRVGYIGVNQSVPKLNGPSRQNPNTINSNTNRPMQQNMRAQPQPQIRQQSVNRSYGPKIKPQPQARTNPQLRPQVPIRNNGKY